MLPLKKRTHEILEVAPAGDRLSQAVDLFIISLILLNVLALIAGTVEPIYRLAPGFFIYLEAASAAIFLVEYLLRLWSCTVAPQYAHPVRGRLRFAFTPLLLIDLAAIAPSLLPLLGVDFLFLRAIRLMTRAARLGRYFRGINTLGLVIRNKAQELLTVVLVLTILLVITSSLMYFAEHRAQPEDFASIPAAMWWSIITLTTVGYGDVSPITPIGKAMAGFIAIIGIGLFALPAGILSSGLMELIERRQEQPQVCPHCGEELEEASGKG